VSAKSDVFCSYCNSPAALKKGSEIFTTNPIVANYNYWVCSPCNARVGTHIGTEIPLGNLGNVELRHWRKESHLAFDPIWKSKAMLRGDAYAWLAEQLSIPVDDCHIGKFSLDQCQETVKVSEEYTDAHQNIRHLADKKLYKYISSCPRCEENITTATCRDDMIVVKCNNCRFRWQEDLQELE